MTISQDYVKWLAAEHQLQPQQPGQLTEQNPWRIWFTRQVAHEPVINVTLWILNRKGEPSRAAVSIGHTRHSIRGANRIKNNLGRVMTAIEQLHLCDISDNS